MKRIVYGISVSVSELHSRMEPFAFTNRTDAEAVAKGRGWYGGDGTVVPIEIFDSRNDFVADDENKRKAAALAKLTDEDRRLLGI